MFDKKIMFSYYVQELMNIHHTTQPQRFPKLFHSNLRMNVVLISTLFDILTRDLELTTDPTALSPIHRSATYTTLSVVTLRQRRCVIK